MHGHFAEEVAAILLDHLRAAFSSSFFPLLLGAPFKVCEALALRFLGGVELGFMSTTTKRSVAIGYMEQTGKVAKMLFEVRMGMIDRGAVRARASNRGRIRLVSLHRSTP